MIRRIFIAVVFWMVTLTGAQAQTGLALIIANQDYDQLRNARGADSVLQTVRRFEEMGFRVELATDRSAAQMQAALADLSQALQDQPYERVIVVYAGYVVSAKFGTWLMGFPRRVTRPSTPGCPMTSTCRKACHCCAALALASPNTCAPWCSQASMSGR